MTEHLSIPRKSLIRALLYAWAAGMCGGLMGGIAIGRLL